MCERCYLFYKQVPQVPRVRFDSPTEEIANSIDEANKKGEGTSTGYGVSISEDLSFETAAVSSIDCVVSMPGFDRNNGLGGIPVNAKRLAGVCITTKPCVI